MTDFNMLNILKKFNSVEKKNLNESAIAECGMDAAAPAAPKTPMSINISGDAGDIATMLKTLSGIESKPAMMAMDLPMDMPMRQDMERLRGIVDGPKALPMPEEEIEEGGMSDKAIEIEEWIKKYESRIGNNGYTLPEGYVKYFMDSGIFSDAYEQNETAKAEKMIGKPYTEWEYDDQEKALEMMPITSAMFDEIEKITGTSGEDAAEMVSDVMNGMDEDYANEPDEEYADHSMMLDKLSGGLNNKKKMYKAAQPGDNAMAVESIKNRLLKALAEAKKSKPDFLDVDKDGDKKEPMKKAIADKKKKTNEAEVQVPNHELSDLSRKASSMAQKIKRKINSGEQMDDRDYNQMAELGSVLSRVGASFGPKSMKDVMTHMVQYTDDRNQEGHGYPEFTVDRFKELLAMAKSTGESMVGEISPDLAKRYTKNAKVDRDNTDHILKRDGSANDWKTNQELQKRNSKRTKGINLAKKRM